MTGTLRYMAPEVAMGNAYDEKCDVYSFTVLLWEMLTLKRAYRDCKSFESLSQNIHRHGKRPDIPRKWPAPLRNLLVSAWDPKPANRPSMNTICRILNDFLSSYSSSSSSSSSLQNTPCHDTTTNDDMNASQVPCSTPEEEPMTRRRSSATFALSAQTRSLLEIPEKSLSAEDLEKVFLAAQESYSDFQFNTPTTT